MQLLNKLPSQYNVLQFDQRHVRSRVFALLYMTFKEVQPVFAKRALQDVLTDDDSAQVIRSRVMADREYTVRL